MIQYCHLLLPLVIPACIYIYIYRGRAGERVTEGERETEGEAGEAHEMCGYMRTRDGADGMKNECG